MVHSANKGLPAKKARKKRPSTCIKAGPSINKRKGPSIILPPWFKKGKEPQWLKRAIKEWSDSASAMPD